MLVKKMGLLRVNGSTQVETPGLMRSLVGTSVTLLRNQAFSTGIDYMGLTKCVSCQVQPAKSLVIPSLNLKLKNNFCYKPYMKSKSRVIYQKMFG